LSKSNVLLPEQFLHPESVGEREGLGGVKTGPPFGLAWKRSSGTAGFRPRRVGSHHRHDARGRGWFGLEDAAVIVIAALCFSVIASAPKAYTSSFCTHWRGTAR